MCGDLQIAIEPYKCENAKLVQECNPVHLDLIEAKEIHQKEVSELKKKVKRLENEVEDSRLSLSKNIHWTYCRDKSFSVSMTEKCIFYSAKILRGRQSKFCFITLI